MLLYNIMAPTKSTCWGQSTRRNELLKEFYLEHKNLTYIGLHWNRNWWIHLKWEKTCLSWPAVSHISNLTVVESCNEIVCDKKEAPTVTCRGTQQLLRVKMSEHPRTQDEEHILPSPNTQHYRLLSSLHYTSVVSRFTKKTSSTSISPPPTTLGVWRTLDEGSNWPRTKRNTMQLLPTPESPNSTSCNPQKTHINIVKRVHQHFG